MFLGQFSSVAQSCLTLCSPMDCSTPGSPVHHQLPELTQTHVHRVSDVIEPSHPLLSPSPPAPVLPSIRVLSNESTLRMRWTKYWRTFTLAISCLTTLKANENENIMYQHAEKIVLSRKFMAINPCIKKKEESQINSLTLYLRNFFFFLQIRTD